MEKEHQLKNLDPDKINHFDEMQEEMEQIKILCIATHIMEMTRLLNNDQKQVLENFCDKIMLSKKDRDQKNNLFIYKTLMEYKKNHIDLMSVRKVSNVQFKEDGEEFFKRLYKKTRTSTFRVFYENMLKDAIFKEKMQKEN